MQKMVCGLALVATLLISEGLESAFQATVQTIDVNGQSTARSSPMDLAATDELVVQVAAAGAGEPIVAAYVYDAAAVLVCRDNPDADTDTLRCPVGVAGRYYVVLENASAVRAVARVEARRVRAPSGPPPNYSVVRVFFATNRSAIAGAPYFGIDLSNNVTYGYSDVSIPRDHRMGELEGPTVWRLEFRADPEKHVHVIAVQPEPKSAFMSRVSSRISASPKREALVFIHGFNTTFEYATRRVAQVAADLGFNGAPIVFSWPSAGSGSPLAYQRDGRNADLSGEVLYQFLQDLMGATSEIRVHLIAHSMGNRLLSTALQQFANAGDRSPARRFQQVAWMAPDIDAELFRRIAPRLAPTAQRLTLYVSAKDVALDLSARQAGYLRAGQAADGALVMPEVDTIDASSVETSTLGLNHAYWADNATIISDLFGLIRGQPAGERPRLDPIRATDGTYWRFRPAAR
jgi:esterase/lipase superfamily enzyme